MTVRAMGDEGEKAMSRRPVLAAMAVLGALHLAGAAIADTVGTDVEERHPNGAHLRITSIERTDTEVLLGVRIVNGHSDAITLNSAPRRSYVRAGESVKIMLVPPEDNERVSIPGRSTVEGSLTFMGAVPKDEKLTLVLNETGNNSATTPTPKFEIDLPAPEDGDAKKN